MKKGWPGHSGNLSLSAICGVSLWQCLLMRQVAGTGRDVRDIRWSSEEAEAALQALFCTDLPSSNQLVLFLRSLLALNVVGLVQDLRKRDVERQGDSRAWAGLGREITSVAPGSADTSRGCRAAPAGVPRGAGRC